MSGEQSSPYRCFREPPIVIVALFRAADPREQVVDRRLEAVFPDVEVLVHEEAPVGRELREFDSSVLLEIEPQIGAQIVHRPHLGLVLLVPGDVFHPIVAEGELPDRRAVAEGPVVGELGPLLHAAFQASEDRAPPGHAELPVRLAEAAARRVEGDLHVGVLGDPADISLPYPVDEPRGPRRVESHLVDPDVAGKDGFPRP